MASMKHCGPNLGKYLRKKGQNPDDLVDAHLETDVSGDNEKPPKSESDDEDYGLSKDKGKRSKFSDKGNKKWKG